MGVQGSKWIRILTVISCAALAQEFLLIAQSLQHVLMLIERTKKTVGLQHDPFCQTFLQGCHQRVRKRP